MEITLTAQQKRVYPFTFLPQCQEGRWYRMDSCHHPFLIDMYVHISFQIMTRALLCNAPWRLRTTAGSHLTWEKVMRGSLPIISKCMVSFTTARKETPDKNKTAISKDSRFKELPPAVNASFRVSFHSPSCPRLPRTPQHPHDYSGGLPVHHVYWPDPAWCVEGAGVSPRPQRGGQVWGRKGKGKMAVGKASESFETTAYLQASVFWLCSL